MVTTATETTTVEQSLRQELTVVQKQAAIKIVDQKTYDQAARLFLEVKTFRKRWKEFWEPLRKSSYDNYQQVLAKIKDGDDPAAQAERTVKGEIDRWDAEQERIRVENQRRADEEARQKAEEQRQAQATEMEISGASDEEIDAMIEAPIAVAAPIVQPTYQKASGISRRDNWCCEVSDLKALCKAIGAGKYKLSAVDATKAKEFFESLLKHEAVHNQSTLNIPGCKAVNRSIIAGRAR